MIKEIIIVVVLWDVFKIISRKIIEKFNDDLNAFQRKDWR